MNLIDEYKFSGRKVLVRVDFNVPLDGDGNITDDTRIRTAIPTLRHILTDGGSVIILTHLGRPKGKIVESMSLKHIVAHVSKLLDTDIIFVDDCMGKEAAEKAAGLKPGEVLMLENLRYYKEEIEGDEKFAEKLASYGDCYVMEAFGTAHRAHASTYTIARFFPYDKLFGYLVENEIKNIDRVMKKPKSPFTAIIGGSKVSTKIQIIENLLDKVDNLIIGGGIVFTFIKAMGGKIGNSLIEEDYVAVAKRAIEKARKNNVKLYIPSDCVIADKFDNDAQISHCEIDNIPDEWMGLDIGIKSAEYFADIIEESATIMWNGPLGVFEMAHFSNGTLRIALAVARATDKGAFSLVGGGDSIAAVNKYSLAHKISYISTAGGALLEYIEGRQLPSIKAIKRTYSVDDYDFRGKRALIRVDFNVPLDKDGHIMDDTRIRTALPTIRKVLADGGSAIIMTHLGRPKGQRIDALSLHHIIPYLEKAFDKKIIFQEHCLGDDAKKKASALKPGDIMVLENLRFNNGEITGDEEFAKNLAALGDVYIMNAFGTAHRAHASTYTIAKFFPHDKMLGYLVEAEINNIDKVLHSAQKPFTAIIGGAKISTKILIIEALLEKVDRLVIGGGIIYTFIKAMGGKIGDSLIEEDYVKVATRIIDRAKELGVELHIPTDCLIADKFDNDAQISHCEIDKIPEGWMGLDIGIKSAESFSKVIETSATVLWNGPMGVFEMRHFSHGTLRIAMATARATDKGSFSLIGGGDSIAAINKYSLAHRISYISTAGGALLEYIEGKELPSLKAIRAKI
ncbi:MAG: phosphoglycerate kinase [Bacteroidota bacterium]